MEFNHGEDCSHCQRGCTHPHIDDSLLGDMVIGARLPAVQGHAMRHGGSAISRDGDIILSSNNWVPTRCKFCRSEARTPLEALNPLHMHHPDGPIVVICGACTEDVREGRRPGHTRHMGRRRRTAR